MIRLLKSVLAALCKRLIPDSREAAVYRYFKRVRRPATSGDDVVLVQCVEDLYYFGLFGQIVSSIRARRPVRVNQFVLQSLRVGESASYFGLFAHRIIKMLAGSKWIRLYNSYCDGVGYRSAGMSSPIGDLLDIFRAFHCWRGLKTKDDLIALAIDDVPVGDLINDSYLRFKPAPTVELSDVYLWVVIWQARRDVRRARSYFSRVKPKLYLTSYSTYVQHGIAVRVALQYGTRVFSFCNWQELAKELTIGDWVHTQNPDAYAADFARLDDAESRIAAADAALSLRMSGANDNAIAYMKRSAYADSGEPVPDVHGALVIFLHDFFDSPHVYRDMVFPDFWEWICVTIETLQAASARFFLKPHPNQTAESNEVLNELKKCYPDVSIMSSKISNKQLSQAGLACAVTVHGTVAHEMAYLGVPTISCARHPHSSFSFCKTAKNKVEYVAYLRRYADIDFDKSEMRRQSLIFYYMHNLHKSEEEKSLWATVFKFLYYSGQSPQATSDQSPVDLLDDILKHPQFNAYVSRLM